MAALANFAVIDERDTSPATILVEDRVWDSTYSKLACLS
jgi:hypothetical protein